MAIQLPDVGTGVPADKTGDSPWLAMKKVRENFNDQTNAASRLVGEKKSNVMQVGAFGLGSSTGVISFETSDRALINELKAKGSCFIRNSGIANPLTLPHGSGVFSHVGNTYSGYTVHHQGVGIRFFAGYDESSPVIYDLWTSKNATKDANGFLKAASPIVKVFADKVELNGEAVDQDVRYKKNGVGDYTVTTVSGLSTDGWYIELPKDMNGNPKVAVTLKETNGVITLKTYKRMFSMETFTFEPDLDNPLDVPEGRWIDLRLNEIPVEIEDDVQTEV